MAPALLFLCAVDVASRSLESSFRRKRLAQNDPRISQTETNRMLRAHICGGFAIKVDRPFGVEGSRVVLLLVRRFPWVCVLLVSLFSSLFRRRPR